MTQPEKLFQEFVDGREDRILQAANSEEPESLYLDFKTSRTRDGAMDSDDRKNLGENLSGFANAHGGVLVWGVLAKNRNDKHPERKAHEQKPIPNIRRFVGDLNSYVGQVVLRPVDGVENQEIELPDGSGYAVTLIPESDKRPHMSIAADEMRYYMRIGSQTKRIDHIQVESMMFRRVKPKLELFVHQANFENSDRVSTSKMIRAFLAIRNSGDIAAKDVAVSLLSYGDRRCNGQLDFRAGTLVEVKIQDGSERKAELFRLTPGTFIYPGMVMHNIEILQPIHGDKLECTVSWAIHGEGFKEVGKLTIDPLNVERM